jgi:chemotaxis signal transduction protein
MQTEVGEVEKKKQKRALDWDAVHQRLAKVNAALEELGGTKADANRQVIHQIWARRAAVLAEVPLEEDGGEQVELVVMRLGEEFYALEARFVFDIRPFERITRVPRTPAWVAGVVNHRGRILSVIDLQRFFGLHNDEAQEDDEIASSAVMDTASLHYLIVIEVPASETATALEATMASEAPVVAESPTLTRPMELALLTGPVLTVKLIAINYIQDATRMVLDIDPEYVRGVVECDIRGEDAVVIVVDLQALLTDKRLFIHEEII